MAGSLSDEGAMPGRDRPEASRPARVPSPWPVVSAVLRLPPLRRLVLVYFGFRLGEYGVWIALAAEAYRLGGVREASLVMVAQLVPAALVAPTVGAAADRYGAVSVLGAGLGVQAAGMGVAAVTFAVIGPDPGAVRFVAYAGAIVAATAVSSTRPCVACVLPVVVDRPERLTAANVVIGWIDGLAMVGGPALAALLMTRWGAAAAFGAMAVVVAPCALAVRSLPRPPRRGLDEVPPGLSAVIGHVRAVAAVRDARTLGAVLALVAFTIGALDLTFVVVSAELLDLPESAAGWLNAAFGAGVTLGGVTSMLLIGRRRLAPAVLAGITTLTLALSALAATSSLAITIALLLGGGIGASVTEIGSRTLLQRVAGLDLLGHAFAAVEGVQMAMLGAGALVVGVLVELWGPAAAPVGVGVILALFGLVSCRRVLRTDDRATAPLVEMAVLRRFRPFAEMPAPELETVARAAQHRDVTAGQVLVEPGRTEYCFVLLSGRFAVTDTNGHSTSLDADGDLAEMALLAGHEADVTVRALQAGTVLELSSEAFLLATTRTQREWIDLRDSPSSAPLEAEAIERPGKNGPEGSVRPFRAARRRGE